MSPKGLPNGLQTLGGTDFDVRGIVQLSGQGVEALNPIYPEKVTGIELNRRCAGLEFLHATEWTEEQGTPLGSYVMHYADGETRELPVTYGETVVDWNVGSDPEGGGVAWPWAGPPPIPRGRLGGPAVRVRAYQREA